MVRASGNGAASAEGMESGWTCLTGNLLAPLVVPGEPEQKRERDIGKEKHLVRT